MSPAADRPHIVSLGAGFGGIYTALALERELKRGSTPVTLIGPDALLLFTTMLHEVAASRFIG